ncbi:MAG: hypothetical protein IPQ07_34415 [Myxococcales bacterium]|nr:hypothetical protein [Myxococcales bacterium]
MSYRDDLEAAHARIEGLEQQLAATGAGESLSPLFERLAQLEQQLAKAKAETSNTDEITRGVERMRSQVKSLTDEHAKLVDMVRKREPRDLPTLAEYNRERPALDGAGDTGVCCSICLLMFGERVEMRSGGLGLNVSSKGAESVHCLRCGYSAMKRK